MWIVKGRWHVSEFIINLEALVFSLVYPLSKEALSCISICIPNFNLRWRISMFVLTFFSFVNVHTSLSMVICFVLNMFCHLWAPSSLTCKFIGQLWSNIYWSLEWVATITCLLFLFFKLQFGHASRFLFILYNMHFF